MSETYYCPCDGNGFGAVSGILCRMRAMGVVAEQVGSGVER